MGIPRRRLRSAIQTHVDVMEVYRCHSYDDDDEYSFRYRVVLNHHEWPPIKNAWEDDDWLDRPIRQWVYDNVIVFSFSHDGTILFREESDVVAFKLLWSQ